jgi:hypothetical protein
MGKKRAAYAPVIGQFKINTEGQRMLSIREEYISM